MTRVDITLLALATIVVVTWVAVANDWRFAHGARRVWRRARPFVWSYVASSPATFLYAGVIIITTWVLAGSNQRLADALLRDQSTNLANLRHHAVDVLFRSAFWSGVPYALPVIALLAFVLAPAEFWLGTGRVIVVFAIGHVCATLLTAAGIDAAVHFGHAPRGIEHTIDVGVSYGTLCVAGVLSYRLRSRWRYFWLAGAVGALTVIAALHGDFADYGHIVAFALGLACYPLTRGAGQERRKAVPMYRPWLGGPFPATRSSSPEAAITPRRERDHPRRLARASRRAIEGTHRSH